MKWYQLIETLSFVFIFTFVAFLLLTGCAPVEYEYNPIVDVLNKVIEGQKTNCVVKGGC